MGLTIEEVAARLGASKSMVSEWENGHHLPRPRHLRAWAKALAVRLEWLATGAKPMKGLDAEQYLLPRPHGSTPPE